MAILTSTDFYKTFIGLLNREPWPEGLEITMYATNFGGDETWMRFTRNKQMQRVTASEMEKILFDWEHPDTRMERLLRLCASRLYALVGPTTFKVLEPAVLGYRTELEARRLGYGPLPIEDIIEAELI